MEKKSTLRVHYSIINELLLHYNNMVKDVRTHYFSELISAHQHNPTLFYEDCQSTCNPPFLVPQRTVMEIVKFFYLI